MLQLRNTSVRIDYIGDGAKTAALTTMAMLADKPKLLLIEEPETKIHPQSLEAPAKAILKNTPPKKRHPDNSNHAQPPIHRYSTRTSQKPRHPSQSYSHSATTTAH